MKKLGLKNSIPLTQARAKILDVVHIAQDDIRTLQKLMAMGIFPGREVEVIHRFPSYVVRVGNTTIALGEEIAEKIYVEE